MSEPLKIGDRVRLCKRFLASLYALGGSEKAKADGVSSRATVTVATPDEDGCVRVRWDGMAADSSCHPNNLRRADD